MNQIHITGASQRVQANGAGGWQAWYNCHNCQDEFAVSSEFCRSEKDAREESKTYFDIQQRRYCYRCGYKLTTKDDTPENEAISYLNHRIDELEEKRNRHVEQIKALQCEIKGIIDKRDGLNL